MKFIISMIVILIILLINFVYKVNQKENVDKKELSNKLSVICKDSGKKGVLNFYLDKKFKEYNVPFTEDNIKKFKKHKVEFDEVYLNSIKYCKEI